MPSCTEASMRPFALRPAHHQHAPQETLNDTLTRAMSISGLPDCRAAAVCRVLQPEQDVLLWLRTSESAHALMPPIYAMAVRTHLGRQCCTIDGVRQVAMLDSNAGEVGGHGRVDEVGQPLATIADD